MIEIVPRRLRHRKKKSPALRLSFYMGMKWHKYRVEKSLDGFDNDG